MKYLRLAVLLIAATLLAAISTVAQENDVKVVDEVVAVVNDGVITLSSIKRQMKNDVDSMVQQGMKREDAQKKVDEHQGELIANLINEELLIQKGKEIGVEKDVEASLNAHFLQIMKQQNFKTLDALYEAMGKEGIDPQEIREEWRKQATREEVVRREVQAKEYWRPTTPEVEAYYEANKAKCIKPETVTMSEIYLSFAGQNPDAVRAKARQLVTQLRGGADFVKAVMENSDREGKADTKGKLDSVPLKDLLPNFAKAISTVKAGGYSHPIEMDDTGIEILRVDERTAAGNESQFDDDAVRSAMLEGNLPDAINKYKAKLREDSSIKINETYRPIVSPLLFADERKETSVKSEKPEQSVVQTSENKTPKKPKSPKRK